MNMMKIAKNVYADLISEMDRIEEEYSVIFCHLPFVNIEGTFFRYTKHGVEEIDGEDD